MRAVPATALSLIVDTYTTLTADDCRELVRRGFTARGGYLDRVTPEELAAQLDAGLAFFPIGFAKEFSGVHLASRCKALGIPASVHVWLDDEGFDASQADTVIAQLNSASSELIAAGYGAAGYFGAAQLLTSAEQTRLVLNRYGKGCSRILDRFGQAAEPTRGYCWYQGRPCNVTIAGKMYDVGFIMRDYEDDLPVFCGA
jgi:hypothetical protein